MKKCKCFKIFIKVIVIITFVLFLMFIWHLLQEWFNPFNWFGSDLDNPISTLFGAILTGGIAYFAIYETSKLDREARIYEYKAKFFYENLINAHKNIQLSQNADNYFFNENLSYDSSTYFNIMKKGYELNNYNESIYELSQLNSSISETLKELFELNKLYIDMYKFLCEKILYFYQLNDDDKQRLFPFFKDLGNDNIGIDIAPFVHYYFSDHNINLDEKRSKIEKINKIKELLLKELALDGKYKEI